MRPTVSINKPDSMEANNWTKPTATAPPIYYFGEENSQKLCPR